MADDINIKVSLTDQIKGLQNRASQVSERGGFKKNEMTQITGMVQELERLSNRTDNKSLKEFNTTFNKANKLIQDGASNIEVVTQALKDANKTIEELKGKRDNLQAKRQQIRKDNAVVERGGKVLTNQTALRNAIRSQNVEYKGRVLASPDAARNALKDPTWTDNEGRQKIQGVLEDFKNKCEAAKVELNGLNASIKQVNEALQQQRQIVKNEQGKTGDNSIFMASTQAKMNLLDTIEQQQIANDNKQQGEIPTIDLEKSSQGLGKYIKQLSLAAIAWRVLKSAGREAVATIKELDKSLTEQAMVTGKTRQQTYGLLKSYQELSLQLGATTKDVAAVATEYMRQGKTTEEALTLTQAAISAAKVAGISATDSINYLTTALNGFQLAASDAMKVSDKFAAIAASSATSYDEIATALSKVASQANLAGMSIDYTTALLAKGLETTREAPETMGTALKTIIARMRELGDYGKTLEGDTDLNNVEAQLSYIGIKLRESNGELRSTEDVLDELGKKWITLNKNQQAAVAKALAGTRQQSRLIAMMSDYQRVTDLQQIAQRSQGATAAQMDTYLQGMEAAANSVQVAWEKVVTAITNSDALIGLVNWIGQAINGVATLLDNGPLLIGLMTTMATIGTVTLANKVSERAQQEMITLATMKQAADARKITLEEFKQQIAAQGTAQAKIAAALSNPFTAALGIAAAAVLGLSVVASAAAIGSYQSSAESSASSINELSSDIYKLTNKSQKIENVANSFDTLNDKLIKTNADLKEMNTLLDQGADSLTNEEKAVYQNLPTVDRKYEYLKNIAQRSRAEADAKRNEQRAQLRNMSSRDRNQLFNSDNNTYVLARSEMYALNNSMMYDMIDNLGLDSDASAKLEELAQAILGAVDAETAFKYATDNFGASIRKLLNDLQSSGMMKVINNEDASLKERVAAYNQILATLTDPALRKAFNDVYAEYATFNSMDDAVLDWIDSLGMSVDQLNSLYTAYKRLQEAGVEITEEEWKERWPQFLEDLASSQGDILLAVQNNFGEFLGENQKYLNDFVKAYGDVIQQGILNMGQNMDTLTNQIQNFYEKATNWGSMSQTDRNSFIADNSDLFSGSDGAALLAAFETGDYRQIEAALKGNAALQSKIAQYRDDVVQELLIERARTGEERNEAYIKQLEAYEKFLNDEMNLFKASLSTRLEQEQNQLTEYKNMLQKQHDLLTESLEKRKEAYSKYFEAVNQSAEDQSYEEKSEQIITNIAKIGASTDANSMNQAKELETSLKELEENRLKELRERAQEAIISNMETTLDEINEKFDKLIDNNRELLAAMTGESQGSLLAQMIASAASQGITALEMQDRLASLQSIFGGSALSGVNWDMLGNVTTNASNQLVLNIAGQDVTLDGDTQQNLYTIIMQALRQAGLN